MDSEDANAVSNSLVKVQAVSSSVQAVNTDGAMSHKEAKSLVASFETEINTALGYIDTIRDSEAKFPPAKSSIMYSIASHL